MQGMTKTEKHTQPWPSDGLESVSNCPVCGSNRRELLHQGLTDRVFFCAPGEWSMYECEACASAYLDPRPTVKSIGLAYRRYFTHDGVESTVPAGFMKKLQRRLANGYLNYRFDAHAYPASVLGALAASLMPNTRAIIESDFRNLPIAKARDRLLDLGCGNGAFLKRARDAGWDVVGVDFDVKAVEIARSQGLDVRLGGINDQDLSVEQFDVITMSHVIEHVHHPLEVLRTCYSLLKPGGFLWLDTPNIASEGHRLFGANWRGLEPPRHLVLFTMESLRETLKTAGFADMEVQAYRPLCANIFSSSRAVAEGVDPHSEPREGASPKVVRRAEQVARCDPDRREFITIKAWKP